jgi:hypothetical protein
VSVNGDIRTAELDSVAYDPVSNIVFGGAQDNGTLVQSAPGSPTWSEVLGGDGGHVAVDADQNVHPGTSIRYSSEQFLAGFNRQTVDAHNLAGTPVAIGLHIVFGAGSGETLFQFDPHIQFYQPFVLDSIDPRRMLIGTGNLYESFNQGDSLNDLGPAGAIVGGSSVGPTLGFNTAMAYGGRLNGVANPDVFYVGAGSHILHRVHLGDPLTSLSAYPGSNVMNLAVDPQDYRRVYVVDQQNRIWASFDEGASWSELTANLHSLTNDILGRTIEIYSASPSHSNDVLIVGALGGVFEMVQPSAPGAHWTVLGNALPHALVLDVHYDYTDNVLVAGTLGRGAWTLSQPFPLQDPAATVSSASAGAVGLAGASWSSGSLSSVDFFGAALGLSQPQAVATPSTATAPAGSSQVKSVDVMFAAPAAAGATALPLSAPGDAQSSADSESWWDTVDGSLWPDLASHGPSKDQ